MADIVFAPSLERLAANLPVLRHVDLRDAERRPNLAAWFKAMDARPSYAKAKSDDYTHNLIARHAQHRTSCPLAMQQQVQQVPQGAGACKAASAASSILQPTIHTMEPCVLACHEWCHQRLFMARSSAHPEAVA